MGKQRGRIGEDLAAAILLKEGCKITARNFHSRYGEIDIIAETESEICFIEVKARKQNSMVPGELSVTSAKQKKIIKTALVFLQDYKTEKQMSFDVISLTLAENEGLLNYSFIKNAFGGESYYENY